MSIYKEDEEYADDRKDNWLEEARNEVEDEEDEGIDLGIENLIAWIRDDTVSIEECREIVRNFLRARLAK